MIIHYSSSGIGAPIINSVEGNYAFDRARNILLWKISVIDPSNPSGSLEFKAQTEDLNAFFPLNVMFKSDKLLTDIHVSIFSSFLYDLGVELMIWAF
jgi:hypothetical protein